MTYAGVAVNPLAMRIRTERFKTLVILDEVHHAGDALSWGEGVREAFEPATRRLALTGTPFRSDVNPIPFVTYAPGPRRAPASGSASPTSPTATPTRWPTTSCARCCSWPTPGEMQWRTRAGDEVAARLGEPLTKDLHRAGAAHGARPAGVVDAVGAGGGRPSGSRRYAATCPTPAGW